MSFDFDVMETDREFVASTYSRYPVVFEYGSGSELFDENGRRYIDLTSGIGVNIFGIADEEWREAVIAQLCRIQHSSNLYYTGPQAKLAKLLAEKSGMKKVFFANSGAEANENALKAIRGYAARKKGGDYCHVISLKQSFHGRTLAMLSATGQDRFHELFGPLVPGFVHVPPDDLEAVVDATKKYKIAGIMIECIQGEGGVRALSPEFVSGIADICAREDIILHCDEVQSGNGRSGYMYAYMHYGIVPDVVSTAKGLGGGLPIGACLLGEKVKDVFSPGEAGSTFGGNPAVAAGACNILERIDDELLCEVRKKGDYVRTALSGAPGVKGVSGLGLMIGVETEKPAADMAAMLLEKGVLVLTAGGKLRILPALNIPFGLLAEAIEILKEAAA